MDCYETFTGNEPAIMLRVETEKLWAFPFIHLLHVSQDGDVLTITFTTHDVTIRGKALPVLFKELARQRVSVLRVGQSSDGIAVDRIDVKEGGES